MNRPFGIELPPISNPVILAYLRLFNTNAPNEELQQEFELSRSTLNDWFNHLKEIFARCDEVQIEQLLWERGEVVTQAKVLLHQLDEVQAANGLRTASQTRLQASVQEAQERLNRFVPVNRTISSMEAIEEDDAELNSLRKALGDAKQTMQQNAWEIQTSIAQQRALNQQYRQLQEREQSISRQIEQLRLPPEQRNQSRSSIVWNDGGSTFMMQTG